jgi:hypothetical protein
MPSESSTRAEWHADLSRRDTAAHGRMARYAADTAEPLLQERFDAVSAELHVLRAAVARRDALLREQTLALRERDLRLRLLEERDARSAGLLTRAVGLAKRVRGKIGRYTRTGLAQR